MDKETHIYDPLRVRWSDSGVDIAVCGPRGGAEWHYLRNGGRAEGDAAPDKNVRPCGDSNAPWPRRLYDVVEYGGVAFGRVGPREFEGGWRRENGELITRDLVAFNPKTDTLRSLAYRRDLPKETPRNGDSAAAIVRDGSDVVWQVGEHVRIHNAGGEALLERKGRLLSRCPDGRLLAYRKVDEGQAWQLFGARHDVGLRKIKREPAFVLGTDPRCKKVFFQLHDGHLGAVDVADRTDGSIAPLGQALSGYVYDARQGKDGLWLASSDGRMHRLTESAEIQSFGKATPRATAMADGPEDGDLIFADDTGVVLRRRGHIDRPLMPSQLDRPISDIALQRDGLALFAWAHGVILYDLGRGEVVGELATYAHGRLAKWDDQGSMLVWPFSFMDQPAGTIIPFGKPLAARIGASASNLRASVGANLLPKISAKP